MASDVAMEVPTVTVGPVHHRCDRNTARWQACFIGHGVQYDCNRRHCNGLATGGLHNENRRRKAPISGRLKQQGV